MLRGTNITQANLIEQMVLQGFDLRFIRNAGSGARIIAIEMVLQLRQRKEANIVVTRIAAKQSSPRAANEVPQLLTIWLPKPISVLFIDQVDTPETMRFFF